jgi:hypothetical protein
MSTYIYECGKNNVINHLFGNGKHTTWGMVYYCFTHIAMENVPFIDDLPLKNGDFQFANC